QLNCAQKPLPAQPNLNLPVLTRAAACSDQLLTLSLRQTFQQHFVIHAHYPASCAPIKVPAPAALSWALESYTSHWRCSQNAGITVKYPLRAHVMRGY